MIMSTDVPFTPTQTHALHPEGGFVYGWTGEYAIIRSGTGKDSARIFGRAWTPEPISEERRKAEVEARIKQVGEEMREPARAAFHLEDLPHVLPAYENLRV